MCVCVCVWWQQLTSVGERRAEGEVTDAPLPADGGPGGVARVVVLHHQRETAPGEVGPDVLLVHHHARAVAHAGGAVGGGGGTLC